QKVFQRWRDELWAVSVEADKRHFWGSYMASLCHLARHPRHPLHDLHQHLLLCFEDRVRVSRAIQDAARDVCPGEDAPVRPPTRHSPDFRSVCWFGTTYHFTPGQAACVKVLWQAWERGIPEVGQDAVLEEAEVDSERLVYLFKGHPAWKAMIVRGGTRGSYCLAAPLPHD